MNYYQSMGMNINNTGTSTKNSRFVLSRRNQKGQVAIFVALIFQVIFVFFALLINVGLLVHHKINLQQSADLAAYYGAMKQAEGLNAIANVNFQIKQAWKLLTWRYRVLGTFGFTSNVGSLPPAVQRLPFEYNGNSFTWNGSQGVNTNSANGSLTMKCQDNSMKMPDNSFVGIQDVPYFCVGHTGFASWPYHETNCQLDCSIFTNPNVINTIPNATNNSTPFGGTVAGQINAAINGVNVNLAGKCASLGPVGAMYLARFVMAYINETTPRIRTIEMLAKDLSLDAKDELDIDGKSIFKGSELTFKNNLTGANFTGLSGASFSAYNGLSDQKCRFNDGLSNNTEFLKKIEFDFINYYIHNCTNAGALKFMPEPVYDVNGNGLSSAFGTIDPSVKDVMMSLLNAGQKHTVGYEKNPHCVEYYAVRASSEPNIPFLPLSKIKLRATAVAKPFGGSIGPWYGKQWPVGASKSAFTPSDPATQMDETLPIRKFQPGAGPKAPQLVYSVPNFSLYVGDRIGLRDLDYLAAYHSMLAGRDIKTYGTKTYNQNVNTTGLLDNPSVAAANPVLTKHWPSTKDWDLVTAPTGDFKDYDGLATPANDSGMRAIEITAIAPNQFDIMHYSIDPDFYHNYYVRLYKGFDLIANAVGGPGQNFNKDMLRADMGAVGMRPNNPDPDVTAPLVTDRTFAIKDQIILKNTVLAGGPTWGAGKPAKTYSQLLNSYVVTQSSLLTGWTFLSFDNYTKFPNDPVNDINSTMSFGQCGNVWNNTSSALNAETDVANFRNPTDIDNKLPPVTGNCVTGGRTGYSVKLISPVMVLPGAKTPIENMIDPNFFNF